eukprot:g4311.t1
MPRSRGRGRRRSTKRKTLENHQPSLDDDAIKDDKKKTAKKPRTHVKEAAIRPRVTEEVTLYLRDLEIVYLNPGDSKPPHFVECVNYHREDVFGHGGENLNKGFDGPAIYLVPKWTPTKHLANITGFQLVFSEVEDPSQRSLTISPQGRFVYLQRSFNPDIQDRIIGLQLYRSRKFNPPHYGWTHSTMNINERRGGDNLYLQWDLGSEGEVPGYKHRFRRR